MLCDALPCLTFDAALCKLPHLANVSRQPACATPGAVTGGLDASFYRSQVTEADELEEIQGSRRSLGIDSRHSLDSPKAGSVKVLEIDEAMPEAPARKRTLRQRLPWYKPTEEERLAKEAEKAAKVQPPALTH